MLVALIYNPVIHVHLLTGSSCELYKDWPKIFLVFLSVFSVSFKRLCDHPHCLLPVWCLSTQKYPHFNTALHWMMDPPLLSRSFVFAPQ